MPVFKSHRVSRRPLGFNKSTSRIRGATACIELLEPRTLLTVAVGPTIVPALPVTIDLIDSTFVLTEQVGLSGGDSPTGTLTFTLVGPSGTLESEDAPVSGNGNYSTPTGFTLSATEPVTGTYQWDISYSGDANNAPTTDNDDPGNQDIVDPASPVIAGSNVNSTTLGDGHHLNASAILSQGYNPTGTLTLELLDPTSTVVYSDDVTVNGNGTYDTTSGTNLGGYLPTVPGTYQWNFSYSEDSNNFPASHDDSIDGVATVTAPGPTIATTAGGTVAVGTNSKLTDSASLSGGASPTGSITFSLKNPSNVSVYSDTVTVTGNGTYNTSAGNNAGGFLPTDSGTYTWSASYSGDGNNAGATDNGQNESETVTATSVSGHVYTDVNGNGLDAPDAPLAGVTIDLFSEAVGFPVASTVSAADGSFTFADISPGAYVISEEVPAGDVATAGINGYGLTSDGVTSFTANFDNFQFMTLRGSAFTDITGNGLSADDTAFPGITIDLFENGLSTPVASTSTATDGSYSFTNLGPATSYTLQEVVPSGYTETAGNAGYTTSPTPSGAVVSDQNFDNQIQNSSISGTVVTDITGDGLSGDDTPLSGVTVDLFFNGGSTPFATDVSAANGSYSFPNLGPGAYLVDAKTPAGDTETVGNGGYHIVTTGNLTATDNFAFFRNVSISGTKYNDLTGNGFSHDDKLLGGVTIDLFANGSLTPTATTVTASNGTYKFANVGPGSYFVQEALPAGSTETGGTSGYTINPTSGHSSTGNNFDDFKNITISGFKYTDITGNGFSHDDTGLGGVTIDLFNNGNPTPIASTVTAPNGSYSFTNVGPGTYKVQEIVPAGWTQTGGVGGYKITAGSGGNCSSNNFDDFQNITISGTKFNDAAGDGFSVGDQGQPGVTIKLLKNGKIAATTTTASDGTYSFANVGPGTYTVQEVVPKGYLQTGGGPNGSAGSAFYTISAHSGQTAGGNNFDDYLLPTCKLLNVYYTINGGSTKYTTLAGHTHQGDTVTATFTIPVGMIETVSLVSYNAPGSKYSPSTAHKQTIFHFQTNGNYSAGTYSITVAIPKNYYQIDFVCGLGISTLLPINYGPDSLNISYSAQNRLISSDNGGTKSA
jgi:hypothetical protein